MKSLDDKEIELLCTYLQLEFPKRRIKRGGKRFKKGVVIPHNYTKEETLVYPYGDTEEMKILFQVLKGILNRIFGFKEDNINHAILRHFNLISSSFPPS